MEENESREFQLLLTNGKVLQLTTREVHNFLYSSRVLILVCASLALVAISDPILSPTIPDFTSRIFYWGVTMCIYLLVLPIWTRFITRVWQSVTGYPIPLLMATAPLVWALTWLASIAPSITDWTLPRGVPIGFVTYLKNWFIAHLIETTALVWLLPLYRNEISEAQETEPETQFVVISGKSIPLDTIKMIKAAEHYLIVTTEHETTEFRARLKDFLQQVDDENGIQTHRSFWVAANEAVKLSGGFIKTLSEIDIPVSRGRLPAVKDWCHKHGKEH